jgi:hypothetical protein
VCCVEASIERRGGHGKRGNLAGTPRLELMQIIGGKALVPQETPVET